MTFQNKCNSYGRFVLVKYEQLCSPKHSEKQHTLYEIVSMFFKRQYQPHITISWLLSIISSV